MKLNEYLFKDAIWRLKKSPHPNLPHQWQSGSALKTGRREMPGSIPGRACRPSRSEFSVVFFETRVKTGQDPFERPPRRALHLYAQVPQADNWPQTSNPSLRSSLQDPNQKKYAYKFIVQKIYIIFFLESYFIMDKFNGRNSPFIRFYLCMYLALCPFYELEKLFKCDIIQ